MSPRERDPFLCAAGSFFFPGLGQVYCGRILRGLVFLIPAVLLQFPYPLIYIPTYLQWVNYTYWSPLLSVVGVLQSPITKLVDLIVRAIATYDAYKLAKSTEAASQSHPNLPTAEFTEE